MWYSIYFLYIWPLNITDHAPPLHQLLSPLFTHPFSAETNQHLVKTNHYSHAYRTFCYQILWNSQCSNWHLTLSLKACNKLSITVTRLKNSWNSCGLGNGSYDVYMWIAECSPLFSFERQFCMSLFFLLLFIYYYYYYFLWMNDCVSSLTTTICNTTLVCSI
jgi:hypothetical protein